MSDSSIHTDGQEEYYQGEDNQSVEYDTSPSRRSNSSNHSHRRIDSDTSSDGDDAWKDTADTWLERWWIRSGATVSREQRKRYSHNTNETMLHPNSDIAYRIQTNRMHRGERSDFLNFSNSNSFRRDGRLYCKVSIGGLTLKAFVAEESVARDTYKVSLFCANEGCGLGLRLVMSSEGDVLVQGFNSHPSGMNSPAQDCGLIEIGDYLIAVNDIGLEQLNYSATTELLRSLDRYSENNDEVRLVFRYGDRRVFDRAAGEESSPSKEQVRRARLSSGMDDADLLRLGESRGNKTQQQQGTANGRSPRHSIAVSASDDIDDEDADTDDDDDDFRLPFSSTIDKDGADIERNGELYSVIEAEEDPIAEGIKMFQEVFSFEPANRESEQREFLGGLSGRFPAARMLREDGDAYARSRKHQRMVVSDYSVLQQLLRQRHLYPSVARLTSIGSVTMSPTLLKSLAQEIFEWRPLTMNRRFSGYFNGHHFPLRLRTPRDTALYQYTEQLDWDESTGAYISRQQLPVAYHKSFIDEAFKMQIVLLTLEMHVSNIIKREKSWHEMREGTAGDFADCSGGKVSEFPIIQFAAESNFDSFEDAMNAMLENFQSVPPNPLFYSDAAVHATKQLTHLLFSSGQSYQRLFTDALVIDLFAAWIKAFPPKLDEQTASQKQQRKQKHSPLRSSRGEVEEKAVTSGSGHAFFCSEKEIELHTSLAAELLTFYLLLKCSPFYLSLRSDDDDTFHAEINREAFDSKAFSSFEIANAISIVSRSCRQLHHLSVELVPTPTFKHWSLDKYDLLHYGLQEHHIQYSQHPQQQNYEMQLWSDIDATIFIKNIGQHLILDVALCGVTSIGPSASAVDALMYHAASNESFQRAVTAVEKFLRVQYDKIVSAQQLLKVIYEQVTPDSAIVLCVIYSQFRSILNGNEQLAMDIATALYPALTPWAVLDLITYRGSIFNVHHNEVSDADHPHESISDSISIEDLYQSDSHIMPLSEMVEDPCCCCLLKNEGACTAADQSYSYLTRLLRSSPDAKDATISDPRLVYYWLDIALVLGNDATYFEQQSIISSDSDGLTKNLEKMHRCRPRSKSRIYFATARRILVDAMDRCGADVKAQLAVICHRRGYYNYWPMQDHHGMLFDQQHRCDFLTLHCAAVNVILRRVLQPPAMTAHSAETHMKQLQILLAATLFQLQQYFNMQTFTVAIFEHDAPDSSSSEEDALRRDYILHLLDGWTNKYLIPAAAHDQRDAVARLIADSLLEISTLEEMKWLLRQVPQFNDCLDIHFFMKLMQRSKKS